MLDIIMSCYFPEGEVGRERAKYAAQSIAYLGSNLRCSEPVRLILAHDGPPNNRMDDVLRSNMWNELYGSVSVTYMSEHLGIGASLNNALSALNPDVWMYTTDDFLLTRPLNLDKPVDLIRMGYDYVRLGPLHPDVYCKIKFNTEVGWFLELDAQQGGYVVATRPFLMTKRYTNALANAMNSQDPFVEGETSYEVEKVLNRCGTFIDLHTDMRLAALLSDGTEWEHIGAIEVGHLAVA